MRGTAFDVRSIAGTGLIVLALGTAPQINWMGREAMQVPQVRDHWAVWAAHNLERMADRVTNICERTLFVVTGEIMELDRSDDEWVINGTR